jgi:hypothetical protein
MPLRDCAAIARADQLHELEAEALCSCQMSAIGATRTTVKITSHLTLECLRLRGGAGLYAGGRLVRDKVTFEPDVTVTLQFPQATGDVQPGGQPDHVPGPGRLAEGQHARAYGGRKLPDLQTFEKRQHSGTVG